MFDAEITAFRSERVFPGGLLDVLEESKNEFVSTGDGNAFNDKFIVAMCMSALEDDAGMWDRYGASFKGIGIHFSLRKLAAPLRQRPASSCQTRTGSTRESSRFAIREEAATA